MACLLLGALAGAAHALLAPREYAATGHVLVGPAAEDGDRSAALGFAQAYGRLATDGAVLAAARGEADTTVAQLRDRVHAATSPDAPLIEITGTAPHPTEAARAANAVARALITYANRAADVAGAELELLAPASRHAAPVSPAPLVSLATGACAGGVLGCLVLFVRVPGPGPAPGPAPAPASGSSPAGPPDPRGGEERGGQPSA